MEQDNNTTAYQMGYSQEEFKALIDKAVDIYFDFILPSDTIKKKEVFDRIFEVSTSPKDIFILTMTITDLTWEDELGLYDDDDEMCICDDCRQKLAEV